MTFKKKLSNFFNAINLMDFRGKREAFYEQLAKSIENKEQFKTFLEEELKIARHKRTRNSSREAARSTARSTVRSRSNMVRYGC